MRHHGIGTPKDPHLSEAGIVDGWLKAVPDAQNSASGFPFFVACVCAVASRSVTGRAVNPPATGLNLKYARRPLPFLRLFFIAFTSVGVVCLKTFPRIEATQQEIPFAFVIGKWFAVNQ
jgi:hypothetical protein